MNYTTSIRLELEVAGGIYTCYLEALLPDDQRVVLGVVEDELGCKQSIVEMLDANTQVDVPVQSDLARQILFAIRQVMEERRAKFFREFPEYCRE
jgi:hypothetical protein